MTTNTVTIDTSTTTKEEADIKNEQQMDSTVVESALQAMIAAPPKMAWGKPSGATMTPPAATITPHESNGGNATKKKTLMDIMAEEAELAHANKVIKEEEDMMKAVLEASLNEYQKPQNGTGISADSAPVQEEEDEIEKAIRLSLMQSEGSVPTVAAAASLPVAEESGISEAEMELIQQALNEAQEREVAESFQLALHLQDQENSKMGTGASIGSSQLKQGNVRTVTRLEYMREQQGSMLKQPPVAHYFDQDDSDVHQDEAGFRINSSRPSQWSRLDSGAIIGPNDEVRTKHDVRLQGQANAHRLQLDFEDGDVHVGNRAFNSFRQTMQKKMVKGVAAHGHGRANADSEKTREGALDGTVRLQITKAINNGLIEKFNGCVKEGKEALVYHALQGTESGGYDVAVKVFKRIQEFRNRGQYVTGDPRYMRQDFSKAGPRGQLSMWAEKEFRNLTRAERAGVPVPKPLSYHDNVIFLRFLGQDGWPSPQLREIEIKRGSKKWISLYEQTMEAVQVLYNDAKLVHGDLSEYNMLVCPANLLLENPSDADELRVALIDFGQAVDTKHPDADDLLRRDLSRVKQFFEKMGITCISEEAAYHYTKVKGAPLRHSS